MTCAGAAMLAALAMVNSPLAPLYELVHHTPLAVRVGEFILEKPLILWINEGLMVFFFLLVALGIVPLFAFFNAGVRFIGLPSGELSAAIALGVALALAVGKPVGILAVGWISERLGLAQLPHGAHWPHLAGASFLTGIGFTMSLFFAGLAFGTSDALGLAIALLGVQTAALSGRRRGFALGLQSSVANAGQALGSVSAGALFGSLGHGALPVLALAIMPPALILVELNRRTARTCVNRTQSGRASVRG